MVIFRATKWLTIEIPGTSRQHVGIDGEHLATTCRVDQLRPGDEISPDQVIRLTRQFVDANGHPGAFFDEHGAPIDEIDDDLAEAIAEGKYECRSLLDHLLAVGSVIIERE